MLWLSIVLAVILLYIALRGLDWANFLLALRRADYIYLPLMFVWSSLSCLLRALRWRILLTVEKDIPPSHVFWANMAGYLGNSILPARAGELIRAAYLGGNGPVATSFALATGLVERFVDLLALIVIGFTSLSLIGILFDSLKNALLSLSIAGLVGLGAIFFSIYFREQLLQIVMALPLLSPPTKEKLAELVKQFLRGLDTLRSLKRVTVFILFTTLIWTMDALGAILLAKALHLTFSLLEAYLLLAALGLSSAVPSTPGYIGVYQFVAVLVLRPFGVSSANALAFVLFIQIMNYLTVTVWGGLALFRRSRA